MLKDMLKAVEQMLTGVKDPKVECARMVIQNIIEHLESSVNTSSTYERLVEGGVEDDLPAGSTQALKKELGIK